VCPQQSHCLFDDEECRPWQTTTRVIRPSSVLPQAELRGGVRVGKMRRSKPRDLRQIAARRVLSPDHDHDESEMGLTNCPLEVIEMIIGKVYFVDLPYFLQTSRAVQVDPVTLHSTKYFRTFSRPANTMPSTSSFQTKLVKRFTRI